ncbi:MAG: antitoxin [Alphaproteobacteria bacterium]
MSESGTAKLFRHGRSQAVRLPKAFRLPGKEVRVRRVGKGVLLEPIAFDVKEWFAAMDSVNAPPLLSRGRRQPKAPIRKDLD